MIKTARADFPKPDDAYTLKDLAVASSWVAWREEQRQNIDGTTFKTKIPFDPSTGQRAKIPTDPSTYGTREQAEARCRRLDDGSPGGVGIVLGPIDGITLMGIDLDGCIEGEEIAPWAEEVLDRFDTYAEVSPSRTGIKLFFEGEDGLGFLVWKKPEGRAESPYRIHRWRTPRDGDRPGKILCRDRPAD